MINAALLILLSIVVVGWYLRQMEKFDLWFKNKVNNFLKTKS